MIGYPYILAEIAKKPTCIISWVAVYKRIQNPLINIKMPPKFESIDMALIDDVRWQVGIVSTYYWSLKVI